MKKTLLTLLLFIMLASLSYAEEGTRLLHEPDISAENVVFVYAGDLWTVPVDGGIAKRLTTHMGTESSPKFSPDGRWIAFSGQYDGNTDVYIIPVEGGEPKRLTFHPDRDMVQDWTPDGTKVLFSSGRYHPNRLAQLFTVGTDGGFPDQLPIPRVSLASYSPDDK